MIFLKNKAADTKRAARAAIFHQPTQEIGDLLSEKEAAPILRLTVKTLQMWRALKKGPRFIRVGRRVMYPRAEIQSFLARNLVDTEADAASA